MFSTTDVMILPLKTDFSKPSLQQLPFNVSFENVPSNLRFWCVNIIMYMHNIYRVIRILGGCQIWPLRHICLVVVAGNTSADQKEPTPFIIEWIPNILPKSRIGELRIKFEYGHQRNGQIEHRTTTGNLEVQTIHLQWCVQTVYNWAVQTVSTPCVPNTLVQHRRDDTVNGRITERRMKLPCHSTSSMITQDGCVLVQVAGCEPFA